MLLLAFRTQVATSYFFSMRPPVEFLAAVESFKVLFRSRCRSYEIRADIYDMYLEIFPSSALKTAKDMRGPCDRQFKTRRGFLLQVLPLISIKEANSRFDGAPQLGS